MRKSLISAAVLTAAALVPIAAAPAADAVAPSTRALAACQPPDGRTTIYSVTSKSKRILAGTNLYSQWQTAPGSITYSKSATGTLSASVTTTVTADFDAIFVSGSASVGVSVGKSWAHTAGWAHTGNVPNTRGYRYRLHLYKDAYSFTVRKSHWDAKKCYFVTNTHYPVTVAHAPVKSNDNKYFTWQLDKQKL